MTLNQIIDGLAEEAERKLIRAAVPATFIVRAAIVAGIEAEIAADHAEAISAAQSEMRKVITYAQDILATYIVPDSGISDHECINQLLGLLDGSQTRAALSAAQTAQPDEAMVTLPRYWSSPPDEAQRKDAAMYHELLYQVGNKYPNETRHQTALRYLRNAENQNNAPASAAMSKEEK